MESSTCIRHSSTCGGRGTEGLAVPHSWSRWRRVQAQRLRGLPNWLAAAAAATAASSYCSRSSSCQPSRSSKGAGLDIAAVAAATDAAAGTDVRPAASRHC